MPYDTVIDKTALENAMTVTADAIRSKTGNSSRIVWDSIKGYADAISGIHSNFSIHTIDFGTEGFSGTGESPKNFAHELGKVPFFAAIYVDDVNKIPSGTFTFQTNRYGDNPRSYFYIDSTGKITASGTSDDTRLIVGWDDQYIYVNAAASTRPWPPSTDENPVKFTMICIA